jgi:hypothetical protein
MKENLRGSGVPEPHSHSSESDVKAFHAISGETLTITVSFDSFDQENVS